MNTSFDFDEVKAEVPSQQFVVDGPPLAEPRCEICGWPYAATWEEGCVPGNCSYRPEQGSAEWYRVAERTQNLARKMVLVRFANLTSRTEDWRTGTVLEPPQFPGFAYLVCADFDGMIYNVLPSSLKFSFTSETESGYHSSMAVTTANEGDSVREAIPD